MDLREHYTHLYEASIKEIRAGNYLINDQIDSSTDRRFGITLVFRPNDQIKNNIQIFLRELKQIAPTQYYYPNTDLHVTVMSIISCYPGFNLATISVPAYLEVIQKSLAHFQGTTVHFQGITASASAVLIQGFPADDSLNNLRNELRFNFRSSGLQESIDRRYTLFTAHATVMRFHQVIEDLAKLIELLEKYRTYDFGTFRVQNIELVYNDWYQREKSVKLLHTFTFK